METMINNRLPDVAKIIESRLHLTYRKKTMTNLVDVLTHFTIPSINLPEDARAKIYLRIKERVAEFAQKPEVLAKFDDTRKEGTPYVLQNGGIMGVELITIFKKDKENTGDKLHSAFNNNSFLSIPSSVLKTMTDTSSLLLYKWSGDTIRYVVIAPSGVVLLSPYDHNTAIGKHGRIDHSSLANIINSVCRTSYGYEMFNVFMDLVDGLGLLYRSGAEPFASVRRLNKTIETKLETSLLPDFDRFLTLATRIRFDGVNIQESTLTDRTKNILIEAILSDPGFYKSIDVKIPDDIYSDALLSPQIEKSPLFPPRRLSQLLCHLENDRLLLLEDLMTSKYLDEDPVLMRFNFVESLLRQILEAFKKGLKSHTNAHAVDVSSLGILNNPIHIFLLAYFVSSSYDQLAYKPDSSGFCLSDVLRGEVDGVVNEEVIQRTLTSDSWSYVYIILAVTLYVMLLTDPRMGSVNLNSVHEPALIITRIACVLCEKLTTPPEDKSGNEMQVLSFFQHITIESIKTFPVGQLIAIFTKTDMGGEHTYIYQFLKSHKGKLKVRLH